MLTKIRTGTSSLHPMLVAFPIVFYTAAFACFFISQFNPTDPFWVHAAYVCNWAGVATAVLAAIPGILDLFLGIPSHTAQRTTGLLHGLLNSTSLLIFIANGLMWGHVRGFTSLNPAGAVLLTGAGVLTTMFAGSFGYDLVTQQEEGVVYTPEQDELRARIAQADIARARQVS